MKNKKIYGAIDPARSDSIVLVDSDGYFYEWIPRKGPLVCGFCSHYPKVSSWLRWFAESFLGFLQTKTCLLCGKKYQKLVKCIQ